MFGVLEAARVTRLPVPGPGRRGRVSQSLLSALLDFRGHGIAVVGDIPSSLPTLALPGHGWRLPLDQLLIGAAAIFLVSFAAGIVTARSFGERGGYPVDADREMMGFGAANLAAGLFSAFPITASDSRTAINASVGGRSQLAGVVAAGDAGRDRPLPAARARHPADPGPRRHPDRRRPEPRSTSRRSARSGGSAAMEFVFAMIALFAPISLGVLNGVLVAIGATFAYLLHKMMYPRDALLGRVPGRDGFYKLHRRPDAQPGPGPRRSR